MLRQLDLWGETREDSSFVLSRGDYDVEFALKAVFHFDKSRFLSVGPLSLLYSLKLVFHFQVLRRHKVKHFTLQQPYVSDPLKAQLVCAVTYAKWQARMLLFDRMVPDARHRAHYVLWYVTLSALVHLFAEVCRLSC